MKMRQNHPFYARTRSIVVSLALGCCLLLNNSISAQEPHEDATNKSPHVATIDLDMMILPGTSSYLRSAIADAHAQGAVLLVARIDTPGGILDTSQEMIQTLFAAPIPVVVYVAPQGATATSAGVFITMAAHVAAMAPGTSIGAAHPVQGDGKDIQGDMRQKAENITVAMVKSIAEQRGRSVAWAEKAVKESSSLTEQEALKEKVVDLVASDMRQLLGSLSGRKVRLSSGEITLVDYSNLPVRSYEMKFQDSLLNVLANPNVAALLWLAATTGLSIELYNPGLILPGVVGVIALVLALVVSQIIPLSQGAIALLVVGAILIGCELFTGSLVLGFGGLVAMVLGAIYLVDPIRAPGMEVAAEFIAPIAAVLAGFLLFVAKSAYDALHRKRSQLLANTGSEGMLGRRGSVTEPVSAKDGKVFIVGEYWKAVSDGESISAESEVEVVKTLPGLVLQVKKVS